MQALTQSSLLNNVLYAREQRIAATPNTEEVVNPLETQPKPRSLDPVEVSDHAKELQKLEEMAKNAPRIDWENRTLGGKKIPDNIHKDPTTEMLSGEKFYKEETLSEKERIIQSDLQILSGFQQHAQNQALKLQEYELRSQAAGRNPDPMATFMMQDSAGQINSFTQRLLEETVLSYNKLGIDILEADALMNEWSLGQFSLADMIKQYFGVDIKN